MRVLLEALEWFSLVLFGCLRAGPETDITCPALSISSFHAFPRFLCLNRWQKVPRLPCIFVTRFWVLARISVPTVADGPKMDMNMHELLNYCLYFCSACFSDGISSAICVHFSLSGFASLMALVFVFHSFPSFQRKCNFRRYWTPCISFINWSRHRLCIRPRSR